MPWRGPVIRVVEKTEANQRRQRAGREALDRVPLRTALSPQESRALGPGEGK